MSEPITLYNQAGETVMVYARGQAEKMLAGGTWYASRGDADAEKVRDEPTPATAGKLAALEPEGAGVTEAAAGQPAPVVEEAAPPSPALTKATKHGGRKAKGGDL